MEIFIQSIEYIANIIHNKNMKIAFLTLTRFRQTTAEVFFFVFVLTGMRLNNDVTCDVSMRKMNLTLTLDSSRSK